MLTNCWWVVFGYGLDKRFVKVVLIQVIKFVQPLLSLTKLVLALSYRLKFKHISHQLRRHFVDHFVVVMLFYQIALLEYF